MTPTQYVIAGAAALILLLSGALAVQSLRLSASKDAYAALEAAYRRDRAVWEENLRRHEATVAGLQAQNKDLRETRAKFQAEEARARALLARAKAGAGPRTAASAEGRSEGGSADRSDGLKTGVIDDATRREAVLMLNAW
jgi:hypothetical protein